jgi:hypothetical protein
MLRRIGYGIVVWAVSYVTAMALMGLMSSDRQAFLTIMIVEGSFVGALLAFQYFRSVRAHFVREAILLGAVWVATSWFFDFLTLVPFADMTVRSYFVEIGFRYLPMFALLLAIGFVLAAYASSARPAGQPDRPGHGAAVGPQIERTSS